MREVGLSCSCLASSHRESTCVCSERELPCKTLENGSTGGYCVCGEWVVCGWVCGCGGERHTAGLSN